jgi:hypothetical protein
MMLSCLVGIAAAWQACPTGTELVDGFTLNGASWAACEDLQQPGGALVLVPTLLSSNETSEWFHKTYEVFGSAPSGSDDDCV